MKLTKNELFFLLESIDALSEKGSYQAEELAGNAWSALYHDELEIEGYERSQWVKFDPEDVDTFPPPGHYLCVSPNGGEVDVAYRSDKCTDEIFASLPHDMRYWRPLPKPPKEETK